MTPSKQRKAAKEFVARWQTKEGNEQRESNSYWIELFHDILGVANPTHILDFERKARGRRIDVFCEDMRTLIENKSRGVDLDAPEQRGKDKKGGPRMVTPYEQAKGYAEALPYSTKPRWIITCNFDEIRIYDQEDEYPEKTYQSVMLVDLPDEYQRLSFLVDKTNSRLEREKELSVEAGYIVGKLYDAFASKYMNLETDEREQKSLNILITRLVFLLYAEDADVLNERDQFYNYLKGFQVSHMRQALIDLFVVLDTPKSDRDPYMLPELAAFPFMNGGLFRKPFTRIANGLAIREDIVIPQFDEDLRFILLQEASADFNWKDISPTIFGAVFESTLNPETRRGGGMHYTSIENIHKLTGPLFYDELLDELARIEGIDGRKQRELKLRAYKKKLGTLQIFDPACGSGNFLTETYVSLRKLENRVLEDLHGSQMALGEEVEVTIDQFHGIEINDFAVEVAKTALWIAKSQMDIKTMEQVDGIDVDLLPLVANDNIVCANALRIDWNDVLPAAKCSFICGNPPFYGARMQSRDQKSDLQSVFHGSKNCGNIDYVAGWYMKAAEYIADYPIRCAYVSTNSICQGEQVANVWKPIYNLGVHIDFAYDTFRWTNEANDQAHVFVVIVGFSKQARTKALFHHSSPDAEGIASHPGNINAYLSAAPDVFVWNRSEPICDVPRIGIGNKPIDGGNYLFKPEEKDEFLSREPNAERFFHPWLGSAEFINGTQRFVLWLGDASQSELEELPLCRARIENVRQLRLSSKSAPTRKLADKPTRFHVENMPAGSSILIPEVSSERRAYIPMGFIGPETFCSNLVRLIPDASLYHFGILQSQFHNAWMRTVCGRMKSDYRYSGGVVYNNFIWPSPTTPQKEAIESLARNILDVRAAHVGLSLATLYNPESMPSDLRTAHAELDAAVEASYGVSFDGDEARIVAHLFRLFEEKTCQTS